MWRAAALLAAALLQHTPAAQAGLPPLCDRPAALDAAQQSRLLRFAAVAKAELEASGATIALVARSGLDLSRFGLRYSHAGISLRASDNAPWSVRQLYYACDEGRPRLYDQGLAGFALGTANPTTGYLSFVLLPAAEGEAVEAAALDKPRALRLLAARYSANAYPFSLRYQNCNQWLAELLAAAWGALGDGDDLRERAQRWLAGSGYTPSVVEVGSRWLMFAGGFIPWVHVDDHPEEDRFALRYRVSLPDAIEAFVRARVGGARRLELCHAEGRVVIHEGWEPIAAGCVPGPQDRVVALDL